MGEANELLGQRLSFAAWALVEINCPRRNLSESKKKPLLGAARLFHELNGSVTVPQITRASIGEFIQLLSRTPALPHWRRVMARSPSQLEIHPSAARPYSAKTITQQIAYLAELWEMVTANATEFHGPDNPFTIQPLPKVPPREELSLNKAQVEELFRGPVFSTGERPPGCCGEASYWIPLLLLWTGARATEIAELTPSDVRLEDLANTAAVRFRNAGGPRRRLAIKPHKGRIAESRRLIPVHNELLNLGFIEYVRWVQNRGHQQLFPDLIVKGPRADPFARFGLWWTGYLRRSGSYPFGRKPATALRKHWVTTARKCGMEADVADYVLGRRLEEAPDTESPGITRDQMNSLSFEDYDFATVRKWTPPPT